MSSASVEVLGARCGTWRSKRNAHVQAGLGLGDLMDGRGMVQGRWEQEVHGGLSEVGDETGHRRGSQGHCWTWRLRRPVAELGVAAPWRFGHGEEARAVGVGDDPI